MEMDFGVFIAFATLPALLQILARDLWLMSRRKQADTSKPAARCMCLESCISFIPLISAAVLVGFGWSRPMRTPPALWVGTVAAVQLLMFMVKDWVIDLKTFRLRRDPEHVNLIFKW